MATKSPRVRLLHIRDEIEESTAALKGVTFEAYRESYMLRRAIERALQIISEAARALPPDLLARYPQAPWSQIVGIGNILRHEYQHLDDKQVWSIMTVHLPELRPIVARMLADSEK